MAAPSQPLASFARNNTSQNGEDGLLDEIFRRLGDGHRWCLEVGACDGEHLNNTCVCWRNRGWSAVLIECSDESFARLKDNTRKFPKVRVLHRRVIASGNSSLDALLKESGAPRDIDLVSIDVDGNDYYLLDSLREFAPRVIIVEHNPTIPPEVGVVQKPDSRARFGASAGNLTALARRRGYGWRLARCATAFLSVKPSLRSSDLNHLM